MNMDKRLFAYVIVAQIVGGLASLTIIGAIAYVAWHFISKFW